MDVFPVRVCGVDFIRDFFVVSLGVKGDSSEGGIRAFPMLCSLWYAGASPMGVHYKPLNW